VGDVEKIDAPDRAYDGVFAFEVLEHFADSRVGLSELSRVLKGNGRLVLLQEFRGDDYANMIRRVGDILDSLGVRRRKVPRHADWADLHRSARSPWGWQSLLEAEGFVVERRVVLSVLPTLLNPVWPALRRRFFDLPLITPVDRVLCSLPGAAWFAVGCIYVATKPE
jgi:SAM-dependent methyltransferase